MSWETLQDGQFQLQMSKGLYNSGYIDHMSAERSSAKSLIFQKAFDNTLTQMASLIFCNHEEKKSLLYSGI